MCVWLYICSVCVCVDEHLLCFDVCLLYLNVHLLCVWIYICLPLPSMQQQLDYYAQYYGTATAGIALSAEDIAESKLLIIHVSALDFNWKADCLLLICRVCFLGIIYYS